MVRATTGAAITAAIGSASAAPMMRTAASRETVTGGEASNTTGSNVQFGMVQIGVRRTGRTRLTTAGNASGTTRIRIMNRRSGPTGSRTSRSAELHGRSSTMTTIGPAT